MLFRSSEYPWPGNIRELRNVLERAVLLSEQSDIGREQLLFEARSASAPAASVTPPSASGLTLEEMEKRHIAQALQTAGGSVEKAAQALEIPRSTLYQKIKKFALEKPE